MMSVFTFPQCLETQMPYGVHRVSGKILTDSSDTMKECLSNLPVRMMSRVEKSVWSQGDFSFLDAVKYKLSFYPAQVLRVV